MTRTCSHPPLNAITWHAIRNRDGTRDQYAIAGSIDGVDSYTVARIGAGEGTRYECWRNGGRAPIAILPDAGMARETCEIHHAAEQSDVHKLARRDDPDTSHMAAERSTRSGKRQAGIRRIVAAVREHPGATSAELAKIVGMDRVEAGRRCPDAREQDLIHNPTDARGEPIKRRCSVAGTPAITWLPGPAPKALTESQRECLAGAA